MQEYVILYEEILRKEDFNIVVHIIKNESYTCSKEEELDMMCGYLKAVKLKFICIKNEIELSHHIEEVCIRTSKENYFKKYIENIKNTDKVKEIILEIIEISVSKIKSLSRFVQIQNL